MESDLCFEKISLVTVWKLYQRRTVCQDKEAIAQLQQEKEIVNSQWVFEHQICKSHDAVYVL